MKKELDYIWRRRSVRSFTDEPLSSEHFIELLEAAMSAPSARNCDPWEFIVVRDKNTLAQMASLLPNGPFLNHCGGAIIVCGNIKKAYIESLSYMLQDCSAALENILLAAPGLGLGGCWLGLHPREERIAAIEKLSPNPEITRFKGLGEISPDEFRNFIGPDMRLERVSMHKDDKVDELLSYYMGKNTMERQNFIIDNLVVEEDKTNDE